MKAFDRLLRLPLTLIPPGTVVPILSGPLRGKKWIIGSSVGLCWLGVYEREVLAVMETVLHAGDVVYDVGAQAGYHALLAAGCVGAQGIVYAFEPLPRNQEQLSRNILVNALSNIEVVRAAVSDADGQLNFDPGPGFMAGHLSTEGGIAVTSVRLDSWVANGHLPPNLIKIDVEGAEMRVLMGAQHVLRTHRPVVTLDTHDFLGGDCIGLHESCQAYLRSIGYQRIEAVRRKRFAGWVTASWS